MPEDVDPRDGRAVRPWVRFWARIFDLNLFSSLVALGLAFTAPFVPRNASDLAGYSVLVGVLLTFCWIFIEAWCTAAFGMTPGKWLMNIRVTRSSGGPISYRQALDRSFQVWWSGMGVGVPIFAAVANMAAYVRLTKKSVSRWDEKGGFHVRHGDVGLLRALGLALFFIGLYLFLAYRLLSPIWTQWAADSKAFEQMAADYNKALPRTLDEETELTAVDFEGRVFRYEYRLTNRTTDDTDPEVFAHMRQVLLEQTCGEAEPRHTFLKKGVIMRHSYADKLGQPMAMFDIQETDCAQ